MTNSSFASRFEEVLGVDRVAGILATLDHAPTILLAGDPGTGKSTIATRVAAWLGGAVSGTGSIVRAAATASGMTLDEYNRRLELDPAADVALDVHAATAIARGDAAVFESRLAGHLGAWLRARGRRGLTTIQLRCEPRERACRLLAREASAGLRAEVASLLSDDPPPDTLGECLARLRTAGTAASRAAIPVLEAQVARTAADRARMLARYGVSLDDAAAYDEVIDTAGMAADASAARVLRSAALTTSERRP